MPPYCKDYKDAKLFTELNLRRKRNNLIARRIRMMRKANLQDFNFFVTFTYSDALHTEQSFKKSLGTCLRHYADRKGWKCMGVWERSPEKQRLHFHGIFFIPEGTMPGQMMDVNDFNFKSKKRKITHQNTYFNEHFGRSDFEKIENDYDLQYAMNYLIKYIEKSGERIVYYGDLPQYFVSDVMEDDIICPYGEDGRKFILADSFGCWDEGEYMGQVSKETIAKMPKANRNAERKSGTARRNARGGSQAVQRERPAPRRRKLRFPGDLLSQPAPVAPFRLLFPKSSAILFGSPVIFVFFGRFVCCDVCLYRRRADGVPRKSASAASDFWGLERRRLYILYIYRHTSQAHTVF